MITMNVDNETEEDIAKRQMVLMKKGFAMGKITFDRDEIHERVS